MWAIASALACDVKLVNSFARCLTSPVWHRLNVTRERHFDSLREKRQVEFSVVPVFLTLLYNFAERVII